MTWSRRAETVVVWAVNLVIFGGLLMELLIDLPDAVFRVQEMSHDVEPMSLVCDNQKKFAIGCDDTVLLCRKDGRLAVPRALETTFFSPGDDLCAVRYVLERSKHRPGGVVYLVVDKRTCRQISETLLNSLSTVSTNVLVVGVCASDPSRNVCERWKGAWDKMICRGREIDISCSSSLRYVDPYVWYRPYAWAVDFANGSLGKRFEKRIIY